MRVLHVIPSLASRTGGPATSVVESSLALRRCGVDVTIFATDMAEAASARTHVRATLADMPPGARDLDVRLFPARWPYRLAFSPAMFRALRAEVRRYDVAHIHSLFLFPQFAAYRAASGASVPYVVSPRGALDPYLRQRGRSVKVVAERLWQGAMLTHAAALHLTSGEEARLTSDVAPRVVRHVVPNGIRCADYSELPSGQEFRRRYLGGSGEPVVMYLGRLSHKKGLDILIRAFALVRRDVPACRLAIVGPDDEGLTAELVALARREGVAERVVFTGMLSGVEKLDALAAAGVWALPSHTENFGNAVVEALAAGRATVISPAVNIAPEIAASGAGIVAPLRAEAFGAEIAALLRDDARREALVVRAREFARRYDWSIVGPRLAEMYAQVAGRALPDAGSEVRICA
jgi:glycosyltransferase involved in cell wall biosynthesis